jgi:glycosyltransferase involved in cell wall biosynthesis
LRSLSIIIPAYNEEPAITAIIQRTIASASEIKKVHAFDVVEIIVVNDGSEDKTFENARKEKDISIITYAENRGYGAAIKLGIGLSSGDIVGFLDADGTCDPNCFIDLCKPIIRDEADVVIGNRLNHGSKMPLVRRIGNLIYADLLRFLTNNVVHDAASGMRAVKREALSLLYPLPDGLNFTPAMSAKALFDPDIRIKEIPISYTRRIGASKLHVLADGLGFFKIILKTAFAYRPLLIYNIFTVLCVLGALAYLYSPLAYYLHNRRIEDYMYYRLSAITLMFIVAAITFNIGMINQRITMLRNRKSLVPDGFFARFLGLWGIGFILGAIAITHEGIINYLMTGKVYLHWVYILTGEFLSILGLIFIFSKIIYSTVKFIKLINLEKPGMCLTLGDFEQEHACTVFRAPKNEINVRPVWYGKT